ncbi:MAG: HAMP domain-containing histidine kinase [Anaerolineales bacterium]|nr:HAMP domain-containing histidine kinase [Anaerolineales bacterium]
MMNENISNSDQLEEEVFRRLKEIDKSYTAFLTNLAFELRTPLSAISGYSQLLLEGKDEPLTETQKRFVTSIQQSVGRLREFEQHIRDIIGVATGHLYFNVREIDLKDIITETIPPYWREHYNQIEFEQNVPEDLPIIQADGRQIRQILQNLFSNASIRLPDKGKIKLTVTYDNSQIIVRIADTGASISTNTLAIVNSAETPVYWRMEYDDWLLAVSRYFIEKQGGSMQIETEDGKGSTITLTLPIHAPIPE